MRKIVFLVALLLGTIACGQSIDVPMAVISAFQEKFPEVEEVACEKLKTNYQAIFEDLEIKVVQFTLEGKWIKTPYMQIIPANQYLSKENKPASKRNIGNIITL